jgi:hypothetical protein
MRQELSEHRFPSLWKEFSGPIWLTLSLLTWPEDSSLSPSQKVGQGMEEPGLGVSDLAGGSEVSKQQC